MLELDSIDRKLLQELQDNAALGNDRLAERVGLSPSAVHRRVRRLETAGVIERRIAIVDPIKVGRHSLFLVGVEVERERPELTQQLRNWIRSEPSVQQAYYVTGSADYVLLIASPDIAGFDAMMSKMMAANPNVRRFTTNVVMTTIKRGLALPLE